VYSVAVECWLLYEVELILLQVTSVRLPSDGGRAKGFGYAEFEDRQSLLDALAFSEAVSFKDFSLMQCVNCFATSNVYSLRSFTSKLISFATF